ncbi:MAG: site-specific integrase [Rhodospirillaceae bacterium]|nr:MAG: site-specific integrase [Rhodospirillaceae bacterium]
MANERLTKAAVEALKPEEETYFVWDTGKDCIRGFGVRVLPNGRRVAVLQYRLKGAGRKGTARRYTIGEIGPDLKFSKAQDIAEKLRASVINGGDPIRDMKTAAMASLERDKLAKERTFKILADTWIAKKENLRTLDQIKRIINSHLDELHKRDVAALTYAELETLIETVHQRAPYMARQVILVLRSILELGVRKGWIAENIADRIEIETINNSRDRVLTDKELKKIWIAAVNMGWPFGRSVQLLILTAARRSEVLGLSWSEIDMDASLWQLPAERAKNNEAHIIHLSPQSVKVLKSLPSVKKGKIPKHGLLFSTTGETPFSGVSKAKATLDENAGFDNWRLHDLRRTAATAMSEMGYSVQVVERVLNHRGMSRSGIVGIYQRSELLAERKAAIEAWGSSVAAIISNKKL